jgi:Mrp family chromosome partitioning ATPase/capsular polysaccharide biosynthesis protein
MLDTTTSRPAVIEGEWPVQPPRREGGFWKFVENVRQRRRMVVVLALVGAAVGWAASLAYIAVRVPAFSASSEILISNTTLQLSGPDAVVTQILVENSLVENALEMLKSGRVLGRVIDQVGLEEIERISPRSRSRLFAWNISYGEADSSDVSRKQAAVALLRANIAVRRIGSSQIVAVRARALTAIDAARLTNEIAEAFVQEQFDANAVVSTSAALRERIKVLGPTARIIGEAVPPKSKDAPAAGIVMLLGIILGGGLGAVGGLSLIGLDRRLRSADQLAGAIWVECFGYVPRVEQRSSETGIVSALSPNSCQSAAANRSRHGPASKHGLPAPSRLVTAPRWSLRHKIRPLERSLVHNFRSLEKWLSPSAPSHNGDMESILRRSILRRVRSAMSERATGVPHVIGVTSFHAGEGKTTLAANLARFIAREGTSVLLIDASCPEMTRGLAQQQKPGLQELLRGTSDADKVIQNDICLNLDFLPPGKALGDLDLLWGNLRQAIGGMRDPSYKWIILDLPELARGVDVRAAGQVFDDLLVVVEWGRTTHGQLQQGLRALGCLQERIIGTVINKVPWTSIDSGTAQRPRYADHRSEKTYGEVSL